MELDKSQVSMESSLKKRKIKAGIKENLEVNNMMPSLFSECHPISNLGDLDGVLQEPPQWIKRVLPLVPRSATVLQNSLSDCHSDTNHYLPRNRLDARILPKTLVCHDYKGGYQADKYLHYPNEDIVGNGYTFYNWAQIDIFVYFSHHLITIPPLCWINIGHSNGVKVLGTLITESEPGSEMCNTKLFRNTEDMRSFARSLAELTKVFGFDGWLLNIENEVENVTILIEFVTYLTDLLHSENPGNLVIWYDSVTEDGKLLWQNELNKKNKVFFDACDGIFLNYSWAEQHLINTVETAKHRNSDVFVGIDVFGRNMYGGGKFCTFKAAELVTRYNLSMAIFAPGWTHETLKKSDKFFEQFLNIDSAFWCSLWPYFYTHPISNYFTTNLYIGLDKACYNIFSQQKQLSKFLHPKEISSIENYESIITLNNKCSCIQAVMLGSKNCCFLTKNHLRNNVEYVHHLFVCDIEIVNNTVVYYLTKNLDKEVAKLTLTILTCGMNNKIRKIKLLSDKKVKTLNNASLLEVNPVEASDVYDSIKDRYLKMIDEQWILSVYMFSTNLSNILEVGATMEGGDSIYLGVFGIQNADGDFLKIK